MKTFFRSSLPFELQIGLRYTRNGRGTKKDGFLSFISGMSMMSIALGVMALIIVLSVMNGFQKDVRDRMLSVLSHVEVISLRGAMNNWQDLSQEVEKNPQVIATAPYVSGQGLFTSGKTVKGALVRGVDPAEEPKVSDVATTLKQGLLNSLVPGSYNVILGVDLARSLNVGIGDKVTLLVPQGQFTPAGTVPRMRQFTVSGVFNSGHYEFDSAMSLVNLKDAAVLFRTGGPSGIRVKLEDMQEAPLVAKEIQQQLGGSYAAVDWSRQNRTWFAAVQVEKRMMGIILFLIVLVGAFGLVSSLVMTVTQKQSDIAILRTLGASQLSIMKIFVVQGMIVGVIGVASGCIFGLLIACNLDVIVPAIEHTFGVQFLPKEIYFISNMPSDPRASDIVPIAILSLVLSLIATLYPSWRASRIHPAEALRYE